MTTQTEAPETPQQSGAEPVAAHTQPPAEAPAAPEAEAPAAPESAPQPRSSDGTFASPADVSLSDILARPDVKAELNKQAKLAAKTAMEEAEEAARVRAERAKMDEVERLKLEKVEAEQRATDAARKATAAERERDLANTLIAGNTKLGSPKALDFLRFNAFGLCDADPALTMADAVSRVLSDHSYLVAPAASEQPQAPAAPVQRPSTAPPVKATQAPAAAKPAPGVDVLSMSKQDYERYKRENHPSIH